MSTKSNDKSAESQHRTLTRAEHEALWKINRYDEYLKTRPEEKALHELALQTTDYEERKCIWAEQVKVRERLGPPPNLLRRRDAADWDLLKKIPKK